MYEVYLLRCTDGSLYTGYAADAQKRFLTHCAGKGAKYTKSHPPLRLEAVYPVPTRSEALRLEARIKRLTKAQKEALLRGNFTLSDSVGTN